MGSPMIINERKIAGLAQRLTFEWRADDLVDLSRHILQVLRKEDVSMEGQAAIVAHILGYECDPSIEDILFVLHDV